MNTIQFSPNRITVELILEVKKVLESGGVVAHPTDTVYGLAANIYDEKAVDKICTLKHRDKTKPFSIMVKSIEEIERLTQGMSPLAKKICEHYLPGPLTVVLPVKEPIKASYFEDLNYIGFRIPDHELCKDMLSAVDFPLVTTSANRASNKTPELAMEVIFEFGEELDLMLDGGRTSELASTIIKIDHDKIEVIREGAIPKEEILAFNV